MKTIIFLTALLLWSSICSAQPIPKDSLYLGQTPPGDIPKVFKLPVPASFFAAERIAISNDGKNIYYQELDGYTELDGKPHTAKVKQFSFSGGKWNRPPLQLFEDVGGPGLSLDGNTMYLEKGLKKGFYSVKTDKGWSEPKRFLTNLKIIHYLQVTNSGNYYISSYPTDNIGGIDLSRLYINGSDTTITSLGAPLNSSGHDLDFFIAKDESYMILVVNTSLCISYHKKDGSWTNPKNLGQVINFGIAAWGPYVTADNKYLFYTTGTNPDYSDTHIYWINISNLMDSLKRTNFIPYLKNKIPDQLAKAGKSFGFTIPENTFIDDDGNNTLTYLAAQSNGSPLPAWLSFDPATRTFSGTPKEVINISINVTATDNISVGVLCTFNINVKSEG